MAGVKDIIRTCLLHEFKLGTKVTEAAQNIHLAFGEKLLYERTGQKWFKKFKNGVDSLENSI